MMSEPEILPLNAQAALGAVVMPRRSQFSLLVRHFLERFFNHETASPDGDAKARLVLIAFAAGLPGFVVALYLWPIYHPVIAFRQDHPIVQAPVPYWLQVNHHLFLSSIPLWQWELIRCLNGTCFSPTYSTYSFLPHCLFEVAGCFWRALRQSLF
jgi:hypothetical protein